MALGEHSTAYLVQHILESRVQTHLQMVLRYSGFPGWYGVDEEESEVGFLMTHRTQDRV